MINFYFKTGFIDATKLFFILLWGFKETIILHSYISLIIISILLGMLFSLIIYKINFLNIKAKKRFGILGILGIFLSIFAPGCAACGVGLASALGIGTAFLSFLPYDGLELSIITIIILSAVIIKTTEDLYICNIYKQLITKNLRK